MKPREADNPLLSLFREFLAAHKPPESVAVAFSGGPDSTALLDLFACSMAGFGFSVTACHLDHGIRKESASDREHCRALASKQGIPFISERIDVPAMSAAERTGIEEAARKARYAFLEKAALDTGSGWVALGHNADDQAETVLMRIIRGSGLRGLGGMKEARPISAANPGILAVRPILRASRSRILSYLASRGISYLTDGTNLDEAYARNRVRRVLIPLLEERFNPSAREALRRIGEIAAGCWESMQARLEPEARGQVFECRDGVFVSDAFPPGADPMLRHFVIDLAFRKAGVKAAGIGLRHFAGISKLMESLPGGSAMLPGGMRAERVHGGLFISWQKRVPEGLKAGFDVPLAPGGCAEIPGPNLQVHCSMPCNPPAAVRGPRGGSVEFVDADSVRPPFRVRSRRRGDRFWPLGSPGSMKLKKFLNLAGIGADLRDDVPLVLDSRDLIFWVAGTRISEEVKIGPCTGKAFRFEISGGEGKRLDS